MLMENNKHLNTVKIVTITNLQTEGDKMVL